MISGKKPENREDRIVWRLENMIRFSGELKRQWSEREMAAQDKYIRVCGESVRTVSLAHASALCGFTGVGPRNSVETLVRHAEKQLSSKSMDGKKEERRLQAYLIKSALLNNREMLGSLTCLSGKLKSLMFAYDEISFGDKDFEKGTTVRLDILAVGVNHRDESFPVVIELKSKRSNADLGRLIDQLNDAEKELTGEKCQKHSVPARLLESATRIKPTLPDQVMKILIWPAGRDTPQIEKTLANKKDPITIIEYSEGDNFPSSTQFKLR